MTALEVGNIIGAILSLSVLVLAVAIWRRNR